MPEEKEDPFRQWRKLVTAAKMSCELEMRIVQERIKELDEERAELERYVTDFALHQEQDG